MEPLRYVDHTGDVRRDEVEGDVAAKFEIESPKAGQYRWVLSSQGRILATSQLYNRRNLAEKAIVSFRMAAVNAPVIDTTVPHSQAPTGKAARATGRVLAKAVVKGGRAVEKVEKVAAGAARKAARTLGGG
jgi:uncharacterized protein YegP (UPF0339 family)